MLEQRAAVDLGRFAAVDGRGDVMDRVRAAERSGDVRLALGLVRPVAFASVRYKVAEAAVLRRAGEPLQAIHALKDVDKRIASEPELLLERARSLATLGKSADSQQAWASAGEEAVRRARQASHRRRGELLSTAALAFAHAGRWEEADAVLEDLRREGWPEVLFTTQGQLQSLRGLGDRAVATLREMRRKGVRPIVDPCLDDDLDGARGLPAFKELFQHCTGSVEPRN
jgi:pentatricopeptide repeat protein